MKNLLYFVTALVSLRPSEYLHVMGWDSRGSSPVFSNYNPGMEREGLRKSGLWAWSCGAWSVSLLKPALLQQMAGYVSHAPRRHLSDCEIRCANANTVETVN